MASREHSIILGTKLFHFRMVVRERQKHIYIKVTSGGRIVVSAPRKVSMERIHELLTARSTWILTHVRTMRTRLEEMNPLKVVLYCGRKLRVTLHRDRNPAPVPVVITEEPDGGTLVVQAPAPGEEGTHIDAIETWLKEQAGEILRQRVRKLSRETGISYEKLYLRNQRTRWGSSSSRGNISLNWRIVMAPPDVQRYLIIHELVHQLMQNHSREYWAKVAEFCPDYRKHAHWLRRHAALNGLFR